MNQNTFRLVYSRIRGMLVAVAETASAAGKADSGETRPHRPAAQFPEISLFALRPAVFGALLAFGAAPVPVDAQVVGAGAHAPTVIQTQNGLPQVNINKPGGAGVSVNTYSQFDVQKPGVILNNSPTIVQTQQAGQINGNPNLSPGQSARIILNQVNSNSPSQLRGYLEVAGNKAEVVVANGSGIVVDGGGFINTTRGILTTGTPRLDASGNLTGFDVAVVAGGNLTATTVNYIDDLTIGSRYTVRGFDGETMLAAERGFFWRNELQWPIGATGQSLYAGLDYGHVFGPNAAYLAGSQLAGAVIGVKGSVSAKASALAYDLFAGTPVYKPSGFPTTRVTLGFQLTSQF
ncbi:filamentous hemagglutinin N-terminal domain-containing protein [Paraburkholderia sp. Cy-641]|nr:filamentous hemagglutinin N-terminal domain-containing protein [Paraburkholderia sp. Cy-641]